MYAICYRLNTGLENIVVGRFSDMSDFMWIMINGGRYFENRENEFHPIDYCIVEIDHTGLTPSEVDDKADEISRKIFMQRDIDGVPTL